MLLYPPQLHKRSNANFTYSPLHRRPSRPRRKGHANRKCHRHILQLPRRRRLDLHRPERLLKRPLQKHPKIRTRHTRKPRRDCWSDKSEGCGQQDQLVVAGWCSAWVYVGFEPGLYYFYCCWRDCGCCFLFCGVEECEGEETCDGGGVNGGRWCI